MRYCHAYLAAKRVSPADPTEFKKQLGGTHFCPEWEGKYTSLKNKLRSCPVCRCGIDIWFQNYGRTRGVKGDSSGFEHVFVGEIKGAASRRSV